MSSRREFFSVFAKSLAKGAKLIADEEMGKIGISDNSPDAFSIPVSPAGSRSHSNLKEKCISCHRCIDSCPTKVLVPSVNEYELEGVMKPHMDFNRGFCDYECNLCSTVCGTGAIEPISIDEKQSTRIGVATVSKKSCLAYQGKNCRICVDSCPASALKMATSYVDRKAGDETEYRVFPKVEENLCIGCGACMYNCPVKPRKAISVQGFDVHISLF